MSVAQIRAIAEEFKRLGGTVVYSRGWDTRGNGQSSAYQGFTLHHTAGGNNVNIDQNLITGIPGLSGPLCNFCIMYDGDLGVIAAHPANHAGASGGWDTAPLPVTGMFNRLVIGCEVQYRGTEPMANVQYESSKRLAVATMKVLGYPPDSNRIKFHNGTSIQGKWDPGYAPGKTYPVVQFRKDCLNFSKGVGAVEDENSADWKDNLHQLIGPQHV